MNSSTYALDSTWRLLLKDLGVSGVNVLRRAGLPDDLLSKSAVRLDADQFNKFWEAIDLEISDPLLPIKICRAVKSESFSPLLFAALSSKNFLTAVQRIARYKKLIGPMQIDLREGRDQLVIELIWPDWISQPPVSFVLTELLFFVALARMGTRENIAPISVTTNKLPSNHEKFVNYLGADLKKGKSHRLSFLKTDVLRSFLTSNESMWASFEPELRKRFAELVGKVTIRERVRLILLEALPGGSVEMSAIAERLGMSPRSLQRYLESENATYKDLLKDIRHDLAQHYLSKTELPTAEISFLLGFEEPNSFFRAFRGWTGQTPESVRQLSRSIDAVERPSH